MGVKRVRRWPSYTTGMTGQVYSDSLHRALTEESLERLRDFDEFKRQFPFADANDYPDFATAISNIGSTEKTLVVSKSMTVSTNTTVPANIRLRFERGGELAVGNGVTVTINGPVEAGSYKIFALTGTGAITFGGGMVDTYLPEWFGAVGDLTTDDGPAFRALLTAMPYGEAVLSKRYLIDSAGTNGGIELKMDMFLRGYGRYNTGLKAGANHPAKPLVYMAGVGGFNNSIILSEMLLDSQASSLCTGGFYGDKIYASNFDNLRLDGFLNGPAIGLYATAEVTAFFNKISNPYINNCKYGIYLSGSAGENAPNCTTIIGGEIVGGAASVSGIYLDNLVTGTYVFGTDIENTFSDAMIHVDTCQGNFFQIRTEHASGTKVINFIDAPDNYVQINNQGASTLRAIDLASGSVWPSLSATMLSKTLTGSVAEDKFGAGDFLQQTDITYIVYGMSGDGKITLPQQPEFHRG